MGSRLSLLIFVKSSVTVTDGSQGKQRQSKDRGREKGTVLGLQNQVTLFFVVVVETESRSVAHAEYSGVIPVHCNLHLTGSSDSLTPAS